MEDWRYEQIIKRFAENGINISDFNILIDNNSLNGEFINGVCFSSDGKFVCIPIHDEQTEVAIGEYCYRPQCFEIIGTYETFCSNGTMAFRTQITLIRRN